MYLTQQVCKVKVTQSGGVFRTLSNMQDGPFSEKAILIKSFILNN